MQFLSVFRGKMLLGYSDTELANMGGYDMVHFDDLAYVASAHQERKIHEQLIITYYYLKENKKKASKNFAARPFPKGKI